MNDEKDLTSILKSHFPITVIETHEEKRALKLLTKIVNRLGVLLNTWTVTQGLQGNYESANTTDSDGNFSYRPKEPEAVLSHIKKHVNGAVVALLDFHPYLEEPTLVRLLKEIALSHQISNTRLVLISHQITLPTEIERLCTRFSLSLPDEKKIHSLIVEEAKMWAFKNKSKNIKADREAIGMLVKNLQGLTISDARRLIQNAIHQDGAITQADIPAVMKAKYELLSQGGVLSFEYDTAHFSDVGGFTKLIQWVDTRKHAFVDRNPGALDVPKGIMLLGVQGGGKSLAAKAVAGTWEIPLLRMDFGALYNKFFGETEKNIRQSLLTAEHMAPCVLWMDEIEKGISSGDYDSGTSKRVLGTLLTWMAENDKAVFIVATSNDISALPPELVRKGRLDEIFFVDFPKHQVRKEIFSIHLNKRGQRPANFDMDQLAAGSKGFSGAEIEQAIVAAMYSAHAKRAPLSTADITEELNNTQPLSVVMEEQISQLRQWAKGRTVAV